MFKLPGDGDDPSSKLQPIPASAAAIPASAADSSFCSGHSSFCNDDSSFCSRFQLLQRRFRLLQQIPASAAAIPASAAVIPVPAVISATAAVIQPTAAAIQRLQQLLQRPAAASSSNSSSNSSFQQLLQRTSRPTLQSGPSPSALAPWRQPRHPQSPRLQNPWLPGVLPGDFEIGGQARPPDLPEAGSGGSSFPDAFPFAARRRIALTQPMDVSIPGDRNPPPSRRPSDKQGSKPLDLVATASLSSPALLHQQGGDQISTYLHSRTGGRREDGQASGSRSLCW
ncbi:hypothetical protein MLD38_021294 [Melastoma candidum]|uniref:Uncharacterized protein n=1 Tax=Melastoma candidum TaxID=119954 RepID=A0ACB9QJI0_9MYRT|nr:hypothetical protein MLD38_021294 [Melastoma candidum]